MYDLSKAFIFRAFLFVFIPAMILEYALARAAPAFWNDWLLLRFLFYLVAFWAKVYLSDLPSLLQARRHARNLQTRGFEVLPSQPPQGQERDGS